MSSPASGGWRNRDHTRGRLSVSLLVLALPILATSLAGVVYQLVDLGFVSRLGEEATTGVIVANQSIRQIVFMLMLGLGVGVQTTISQAIGAGRSDDADHVAGQALVVSAVLSLIVAVLGTFFSEHMLRFMQVSPAVLEVGTPYLQLTLILSFGVVYGQVASSVLAGAGDSTTPMVISVVQTVVSLAAEWLLIFGNAGLPELGILGVAWGVLVGQLVGIAMVMRVLLGGDARVHLRWHHLRPDGTVIGALLRLSWPPALQMVGGFLVTALFLRMAGGLGDEAQAAYSIGLRLSMLGPMLAFPVAGACATLVGQNLGAGRVDRARASVRLGLYVSIALLWSMAALFFLAAEPIVAAFAERPGVIEIGTRLLRYQAGVFLVWAIFFVLMRSLQGAGDVRVPMLISLANSLFVTLPLGVVLSADWGLDWGVTGLLAASLVGGIVVTGATGAWFATGRWQHAAPLQPNPPTAR